MTTHHITSQHNSSQHNTSHHITSQHNTSHHITTQYITSHHNTIHHNTSQHITSHHNTTHHNTTHHITSQHNTSHHITTQYITTHHNTSHDMTTHHITSQHNTYNSPHKKNQRQKQIVKSRHTILRHFIPSLLAIVLHKRVRYHHYFSLHSTNRDYSSSTLRTRCVVCGISYWGGYVATGTNYERSSLFPPIR